jgi:murein DD-endopeptidase MepM/ murein hydrolase activator NlpD
VIDIVHSDGFLTRYAHLSVRMVKEGDMVQRHQLIGQVGSTGRSTGPHLHYEIHRRERPLNPTLMLSRNAS